MGVRATLCGLIREASSVDGTAGAATKRASSARLGFCNSIERSLISHDPQSHRSKTSSLCTEVIDEQSNGIRGVVSAPYIYHQQPWGDATQPALMLTGLAGTGKTQLMQAMKRFLGDRVGRVDLPGHRNLEIQPAWFMSLRDGNTLNSLLGPCVVPEKADCDGVEIPKRKDLKQSQLLQLARRVSRRDGVCIIFLDEFQFITRSQDANTLAMTLLLQLLSVGPRVVYVANFSLARRLMNRRQEDRHRVLANHLELQPDAVDGSDFLNYITELTRIVPEDFRFETSSIAGLLHRYSYGIKRAVMELLVAAWAHAKAHRGTRADVTESDVKAADLALRNISQKWTMPIRDWKAALTRFTIQFGDRFSVN